MATQRLFTRAALFLASAAVAQAQYPGGSNNPFNNGGDGSGNGNGNGNGNNGQSFGFGNLQGGPDFDINEAISTRRIHGVLGALAMVVFFPVGSILMRVLPGPLALWSHAIAQIIAYIVYIAAVGLGFNLVQMVKLPEEPSSLMDNERTSYHPIIGIVVLLFMFAQPFLGYKHHKVFKQVGRRQIWSYLHLYNGRIMITLGIANGGLGLWMADQEQRFKTAYVIVASVMWAAWMLVAVWSEWRRTRAPKKTAVEEGRF